MDVSQAYKILWATGILFVILPHLNSGLLSDYKICGDSECESLMSRVQATRDHRGQDCRFLSFRRGDTIFVYHKLTGRRDDLWAGSIDKQFGYFPKEAVEEELVYAAVEKVVETQKSDFFCMDEFGYPIDSSYLDSEEDYQKIPNQETESSPYDEDAVTESPPTSEDVSTEAPVSAQEEEDDTGDIGRQHEEAQETPLDQQGGSAPSSWLGSSVTGWLGLSKEEEGEKTDEGKESQVAASVTGWLGLGGAGKPHDEAAVKDGETADSLASTMTGWLGFGGEKEKDKEDDGEPAETFRSRRMSLNLEGSQLQEEEEKETETGTLGWLGNGLSSRLGFGRTNQEAGQEAEREAKEEEQPASGSWFDIGVGDMLGFRKDKSMETEEQPAGSESVDPSQAEPAETEEGRMETSEESKVEETPDTSDSSKDSVLPEDAASKVDGKEISTQIPENIEGEDHQMHKSIETEGEDSNRQPEEQDVKTSGPDVSWVDLRQPVGEAEEDRTEDRGEEEAEIQNQIDNTEETIERSVEVGANSHEGEGNDAETDVLDREIQESEVSVGGESRDDRVETSVDDSDSLAMIDTEIETRQEGEGSSQGFGSSSSAGMMFENASEDDRRMYLTSESTTQVENDVDQDSVTPNMQQSDGDAQQRKETEREVETEEVEEPEEEEEQEEVEELEEVNAQEELQETVEGKEDEIKELGGEVEEIKEEEKQEDLEEVEEKNAQEKLQEIEEEKQDKMVELDLEEEGEVEEIKEEDNQEEVEEEGLNEEKQEEVREIKEEEKQDETEEIEVEEMKEEEEEKQGEEEGLNEEKQEEVEVIEEEEKLQEVKEIMEEGKKEDVDDLKKEEKQEVVEEIKEEDNQEEGSKEEETKDEMEEIKEEKMQEVKEIMEEGKKEGVDELKEEETQGDVEEIKEEGNQEEGSKEEETKDEMEEIKEEKMQEEVDELMEEEKQQQIEEVKEEEEREVEGVKDQEKEDGEGSESDSSEKSESVFSETSTQTENLQMEEEEREEEEVEVKQEMEDMEGEEGANSLSSTDEETVETREQNPGLADRQGEKKTKDDGGQNNQLSLGQTAENKEDDQLYFTETENDKLSDDDELRQEEKIEPEDTETISSNERKTEQMYSDHNVNSEEDKDLNTGGSEFSTEGGTEVSVLSDDSVTLPSDGDNDQKAETESRGTFGLFQNAFSFFGQKPVPETEESTESAPSLDSNTGETSKTQASLSPEQELDPTTAPMQDLLSASPITESEPSPPSTSPPSPTQTPSHPTEPPLQTHTLTKHYQNLLAHMSAEETTVLTELFGRHKLQFLDYIIATPSTDDPGHDESILLDIERLLHHHREVLFAPSMKLADAPQENKDRTRALIALQKLEILLAGVRETFITGDRKHEAEASSKDKEMSSEEDSSVSLDNNNSPRDEGMEVDKEKDGRLSESTGKHEGGGEKEQSEEERASPESRPHIQPESPQTEEGGMKQIVDFVHQMAEDSSAHVHAVRELLTWLTVQVVSSLPDDIRPGPDLYGVPWEPVIISSVVGLVTVLLFTCRCYSSVKSRMYRSKERWMAEQVAQLLDEKCKVLETLSKCQQEYDELENSLRDSGVLAQTQKTEHLEVKARQLGHTKRELDRDIEQLKDQLEQQREHRAEQERRITVLEESMKTSEEESKDLQSQEEQAQTTLKVYSMNSDRLQRNLETAGEENTLLQESNAQLRQQVEGWAERVSELEAEMSRCEVAHSAMLQDVANKDERITSLTDRLLRMKGWDSDLEEEEGEDGGEKETSNGTADRGEENGRGNVTDTQGHLQKVQKLIYAAKLNADLKSVDEDKDRLFAKLDDEVKAKEDLQVSIKELDNEKVSLQSDTEQYSDQVQRLQQKLQIMTEMYQENELKLHRLLTVEEKERLQKEEKLNKADKNIALAMEELSNYRQRAGEMEEELEKTKQSYQTQISAHEKKAHNNWLAARAADRELSDIRRENGLLRQKLTDTQFKLDALDKDPYALDSLARPLPFRAERSPYGPSPLGRPSSETRAFLSPPTLMDGPPARLSPRASRGPVEPPGGPGEMMERSGPHSDSGSISPTWERDRRGPPPGPPGPPGYMFPEPGGPMFRRPPLPPPGALGLLPPPGSLPPGPLHPRGLPPGPPHPLDMADGSFRENSFGPGEDHREPGDRRTPPEADLRMGGPPPPGPPMGPMGPMDGPFPRRAPYGPPPPDFYPPRGPGGPPMMPMWAPPPPGMMFPPRFPPGGPPHPHYAPPMRPPLPDGHPHPSMGPPQPSLPSQSPEEHTPSPEDAI